MRRLRRSLAVPALVAAAVLLLAACGGSSKSSSSHSSSGGSGGSTTKAVNIAATGKPCSGLTFAVITHGDNGSFWSVVYKGAKNAAADYGCKL
ncbi:MAG TPA: hypothetical protein VHW04_05190, partial [Solirubrobacteraceae bacterium]|nr:hypothetical protein [Solirubrobacteraceae bacterium]